MISPALTLTKTPPLEVEDTLEHTEELRRQEEEEEVIFFRGVLVEERVEEDSEYAPGPGVSCGGGR